MHRIHSTITFSRMKQSKIKIQLEFHQEIAKSALWCPFSFWNFAVSRVWRTGRPDHYFPRGPRRYPSCGQSILRTLLLAAVAVMAAKASDLPGGPPSCLGLGGQVTRFRRRVRSLHVTVYGPTIQSRPVSQSGRSPAPHRRCQTLP